MAGMVALARASQAEVAKARWARGCALGLGLHLMGHTTNCWLVRARREDYARRLAALEAEVQRCEGLCSETAAGAEAMFRALVDRTVRLLADRQVGHLNKKIDEGHVG